MIPFIVAPFFLALALRIHAVPVTQTSLSDPIVYDAVLLGTNNIIELMPATTGLPIPVSTLLLPASIITAIENIVDAIEAGDDAGRGCQRHYAWRSSGFDHRGFHRAECYYRQRDSFSGFI